MTSHWPPPPRGGRRKRELTEDERALWKSVNRETVPLLPSSTEPYVPKHQSRSDDVAAPFAATMRPSGRTSGPSTAFFPTPPVIDPLTARTPGIDKATAKSLRKGERAPDARLDLHGMTLDRAHAALTQFILASQRKGLRCVLVITGKGDAYRRGKDQLSGLNGSLKRDVPRWLRLTPLASSIVGVFEAHQRHGGAGALYVYLKRHRG